MSGYWITIWIVLVDNDKHVLPDSYAFRSFEAAQNMQRQHPGSRLRKIHIPDADPAGLRWSRVRG